MRSLAVGLVAATALAACGDIPSVSDAGVDAPIDATPDPCDATSLSTEQFLTCVSLTFCEVLEDCMGSDTAHLDCANLPLVIFDDLLPNSLLRVLENSTAAGRTQWNPQAASVCLANLRDARCELFAKNVGNDIFNCGAIVGNVTDGQPCQADFECATEGAVCVNESGASGCGARVCKRPASVGESCSSLQCRPGDHCVRTFVASTGTDTSTCRTGAAGAPCDRNGDCDRNLFCNGGLNNQTAAGVCSASKPVGSICKDDRECLGELMCVGETGTADGFCTDTRVAGAQCDSPQGCLGHQQCIGPQSAIGTCMPAVGPGDACVTSGGQSFCGFTLACDRGTCGLAGALGDPCTSNAQSGVFAPNPNGCSGTLFCSTEIVGGANGTCEEPRLDGQGCGNNDHCVSGYCDRTANACAPIPVCF